jgi:hypothetical protein
MRAFIKGSREPQKDDRGPRPPVGEPAEDRGALRRAEEVREGEGDMGGGQIDRPRRDLRMDPARA